MTTESKNNCQTQPKYETKSELELMFEKIKNKKAQKVVINYSPLNKIRIQRSKNINENVNDTAKQEKIKSINEMLKYDNKNSPINSTVNT